MHDADAIEAINREQLATATDRLLLRGGQFSRDSVARSAHGGFALRPGGAPAEHALRAARSRSDGAARAAPARSATALPVVAAQGTGPHARRQRRGYATTMSVRTPVNRPLFAIGIAIPILVGAGLAVAALR